MRALIPVLLLLTTGCSVENDPGKEQVTVKYDREKIKQSASEAGHAAKAVATGVANVAEGTGRAIKKEVGDVDVDLKVTRKPADNGERPDQAN